MCIEKHTDRRHLTQEDRAVIEALHTQGATLRTIAGIIHKHHATVFRELRRNRSANGYTARYAQKRYRERRFESKFASRTIECNKELARHIEDKLCGKHTRGDWSSAVIANVLGTVCHQTIYTWIRRSRPDLRSLLPRSGRYRRKYGSGKPASKQWMVNMRPIETRPDHVYHRTEVGHFEGDTIVLERGVRALITVVDRKSRFLIADLISASVGIAYEVHEALVTHLTPLSPLLRQTITPDRGSEFSWWDMTEKEIPGLLFYFAHARSPWERGTNEHTNGLLRRYFPKGEKHETITKAQVADVVWMINHRPRKSLNWEAPCKVFGECCSSK